MSHDIAAHARELHRQAIVIDGHSDILIPIADGKMRLGERVEVPDAASWQPWLPAHVDVSPDDIYSIFSPQTLYFGPMGQYDIPRFIEGGLTAQTCAIYIEDGHLDRALQRGLEMAWWLHREVEDNPGFELFTSVEAIRRAKAAGRCGAIISIEGCEALGTDVRFLDLYYKLGLRMASLTHCRRNLFADGPQDGVKTGGLTALGRQAIQRMNELGIVVDLVHISEEGFWEILALSTVPVVLSHSTGTMFAAHGQEDAGLHARPGLLLPRDRPRLEALARNGGVLGIISFYQPDLDAVIADIETALDVMGPDHVGLGSDYYGLDMAPSGLADIGQLPAITRRLVERGHADDVILKILGENYLRVFEQVWKPSAQPSHD